LQSRPAALPVAPALFLVFVIGRSFFGKTQKKKRGDVLLIAGSSNSGKTVLNGRLVSGNLWPTVTSMKEMVSTLVVGKKKTKIRVLDYPGHFRLREGLNKFLPDIGGIIYLVDANSGEDNIKRSADLLYFLFTEKNIYNNQVPFFIACNKSDMHTAKK